jgi:hypothetical protein
MLDPAVSEIARHREGLDEAQWLADTGILDSAVSDYAIETRNDWKRLGSETYILDFEVTSESIVKRLIAKACVKFCPSQTIAEWHDRRNVIEGAGIAVPKLYSTHGGVYIEEFIAYDLRAAYSQMDLKGKHQLHERFTETYVKLGELGFSPVSLHDARSRGSDVVLIDFGSDLGGQTRGRTSYNESNELANREFEKITKKVIRPQ